MIPVEPPPSEVHSLWDPEFVAAGVSEANFRAHGPYLWQSGVTVESLREAMAAMASSAREVIPLMEEDGAFGAVVHEIDGQQVSRDVLDSAMELTHFQAMTNTPAPAVLDIGSGYGRLAHRASEIWPESTWLCADGVHKSNEICRYYLSDYRKTENHRIVEATQLPSMQLGQIDLAVAVHSLPEMPARWATWWLDVLRQVSCPVLVVITDMDKGLSTWESDWSKRDLLKMIREYGYVSIDVRPKYLMPTGVDGLLYPDMYHTFKLSTG